METKYEIDAQGPSIQPDGDHHINSANKITATTEVLSLYGSVASKLDLNISALVRMMDNKEIDFDIPEQRGYVWNKERKNALIISIVIGWPISTFYLNKTGRNQYDAIDCKQRATTIYEFINNRFKLNAKTPSVVDEKGNIYVLAEKSYKDLDDVIKEKITSYGLLIYCFDNLGVDDRKRFFKAINNGQPITSAELTRVDVLSRDVFFKLTQHTAIVYGVTKVNKRKNGDVDIVQQMWMIFFDEKESLENKDIRVTLSETEVTEEQVRMLTNALDYVYQLFLSASNARKIRKMKNKTHFVSLAYAAHCAIRNKIPVEKYIETIENFFIEDKGRATISDAYNFVTLQGSARKENVRIRKAELEKLFQ